MTTTETLPFGVIDLDHFYPVARFHPEMDVIEYQNEDVSYRAERVDGMLTLLWHPKDERLIGIALKGFRFLFQQLKERHGVSDDKFLPLIMAVEEALVLGAAEGIMADAMAKRQQQYESAKRFVATLGVPAEELRRAA